MLLCFESEMFGAFCRNIPRSESRVLSDWKQFTIDTVLLREVIFLVLLRKWWFSPTCIQYSLVPYRPKAQLHLVTTMLMLIASDYICYVCFQLSTDPVSVRAVSYTHLTLPTKA